MRSSLFLKIAAYILFVFLTINNCTAQLAVPNIVSKKEIKRSVLKIMEAKCNPCHQKRNPGKVFTLDNMDAFSQSIHRQVFILKRMPKGGGRKKMTEDEFMYLKIWLDEILNNEGSRQ